MTQVILTAYDYEGNGTILDLYENETIAQTWRFTDISELKALGGFSRQFSMPASDTNVSFFGSIDNVNGSSWFKFGKKVDAVLTVDTVPIAKGHLQLRQVVRTKDNGTVDYDVVFYSETPDLVTTIGDKKLKDISTLSTLNEVVDSDSVTALTDAEMRYFLCDRGQKWSQMGEAGTRPVWNENNPIWPSDLTPHINALWLFNQILLDAGFTWEGTTLEAALTDYWVTWINQQNIQFVSPEQNAFFEAVFTTNQVESDGDFSSAAFTEQYDNGGNLTSGVYSAPYTAYFQFNAWTNFTASTSGVPSGEEFYGVLLVRLVDVTTGLTLAQQDHSNNGSLSGSFDTFNVLLISGQQVRLDVLYDSNASSDSVTYFGNANATPQNSTGWRLAATSNILSGGTIDVPLNAPDITQMDFLKDIVKMHNLAIIPDRNIENKIHFVPLAEYITSGTVKDWTGKLNVAEDIIITPTNDEQKQTLLFTYKAGGDAYSKLYVDQKQRVYGDYKVTGYTPTSLEQPSDFASGELKIELVAQSTPCGLINGTPVPIPKFVGDTGNFVSPGLRFLYTAGTMEVYMVNTVPATELLSVNIGNHYSQLSPTVNDNDLNFAPEAPLHAINGNPYSNLFNLYWRGYLNEIYSEDARIMDASFKLDINDVLNFKFNDKLFIRDAYWRILEISNFAIGQDMPVRVKLMKILDTNIDCQYQPVSVEPDGTVVFEDSEGTEGDGNQLCCERYGYYWIDDGTRQYCSAFPPSTGSGGQVPQDLFALGMRAIGQNSNSTGGGNAMKIGSGINTQPDTNNGYLAGNNISIGYSNPNMIAVGDSIEVQDETGGLALGKNLLVGHSGIHFGGGWYDKDRSASLRGRSQHGIIQFMGEGDFDGNGSQIAIYIDGDTTKHLNLPSQTMWTVIARLSIIQQSVGAITGAQQAVFGGVIIKTTTAGKAEFTSMYQDGDLHTMSIEVDTTTNTAQHRLFIQHNDGTTHTGCKIALTLEYTQVR